MPKSRQYNVKSITCILFLLKLFFKWAIFIVLQSEYKYLSHCCIWIDCTWIEFSTKRNKSSIPEELVDLGVGQNMYKMFLQHLVKPDNQNDIKGY